jgi:hypothetical protein
MKYYANQMAAFFSSGHSVPVAGREFAPDVRDRQSLSGSAWDEILAASVYDENARTFLDHWGPRGK